MIPVKFHDLRMRAADDLHIHLRNDDRTAAAIAAVRGGGSARVLAMPNTTPALANGGDAERYRGFLRAQGADFEVLTTIKLTAATTAEDVRSAAAVGVAAAKQYPLGVTTNAEDGVTDPRAMFPIYAVLQELDMVLSLHGEVPGVFVMDAEAAFLESLLDIHRNFPRLRIVLEHITTRAAVDLVAALPEQIAATITDHHLVLTLDDVAAGRIQPHHFCMPLAKRPEDRAALVDIVKRGHPSFFSGTDSAPHRIAEKECASGCAGIFNAPFHLQFLATFFESQGMLARLADFTSKFGADFYGLAYNQEEIVLVHKPLTIPARFHGLVPFRAGHTLTFSLDWV